MRLIRLVVVFLYSFVAIAGDNFCCAAEEFTQKAADCLERFAEREKSYTEKDLPQLISEIDRLYKEGLHYKNSSNDASRFNVTLDLLKRYKDILVVEHAYKTIHTTLDYAQQVVTKPGAIQARSAQDQCSLLIWLRGYRDYVRYYVRKPAILSVNKSRAKDLLKEAARANYYYALVRTTMEKSLHE